MYLTILKSDKVKTDKLEEIDKPIIRATNLNTPLSIFYIINIKLNNVTCFPVGSFHTGKGILKLEETFANLFRLRAGSTDTGSLWENTWALQ